jgi:hypothetical protein
MQAAAQGDEQKLDRSLQGSITKVASCACAGLLDSGAPSPAGATRPAKVW